MEERSAVDAVDVLVGTAALTAGAVRRVVTPVGTVVLSTLGRGARLVADRVPDRPVDALARRGGAVRAELERHAADLFGAVVRRVVEAVLNVVDLTDVVRRHVDLDALGRELDVRAVVNRVDVDEVAARLDIEAVLARVDIDAVAARLDLEAVLDRVDVDAVAARLDIEPVMARVDPDMIAKRLDVDAVVSRADLEAVLARLDLPRIAMEVIAEIDLPEILRESTGSAASELARGVRTEGVRADEAVARVVDRLLRRERRLAVEGP